MALLRAAPAHCPRPDAPLDARVVAVSRASEHILQAAGAWAAIRGPRLEPYQRMRIWHEGIAPLSAEALVFDAADAGEPNLGYILENRLLQGALLGSFARPAGTLRLPSSPALAVGRGCGARCSSPAGRSRRGWWLAPTARSRPCARLAGISADSGDYRPAGDRRHRGHGSGRTSTPPGSASCTTARSRFLPLADGTSSIVWSAR